MGTISRKLGDDELPLSSEAAEAAAAKAGAVAAAAEPGSELAGPEHC